MERWSERDSEKRQQVRSEGELARRRRGGPRISSMRTAPAGPHRPADSEAVGSPSVCSCYPSHGALRVMAFEARAGSDSDIALEARAGSDSDRRLTWRE